MSDRLEMVAVCLSIFGVGNLWAAVTCPPGMIQNVWFAAGAGVALLGPIVCGAKAN